MNPSTCARGCRVGHWPNNKGQEAHWAETHRTESYFLMPQGSLGSYGKGPRFYQTSEALQLSLLCAAS